MTRLAKIVLFTSISWTILITVLHSRMNTNVLEQFAGFFRKAPGKFSIGFLPVTCHLTCPVTDFINKSMNGKGIFEPKKFSGFPELKEAFLARDTQATFILAPMAMALKEQGVPIKIVYLGHRDGTAMVVHKDSGIYRIEDLKGKKIAIPNRFSNQRLLLFRAFRDRGMNFKDVELFEMPPPDMPAALYAKAVDAITSGEPYMGQTEMGGYGRVLYLTKDIWPNFISCVLAVHEDVIQENREAVQELVNGIARSGKWLDESLEHRMDASQFVAKNYYNQDPQLLEFVLSKPADRVKYTNLSVRRADFEEIEELGVASGILSGIAHFQDYADDSFVTNDMSVQPYEFEVRKK